MRWMRREALMVRMDLLMVTEDELHRQQLD